MTLRQDPAVTIALPVYNGAGVLRETLDSWLAQTFQDFELVVSDNASTDATPDILAEVARRESRVRIVRRDVTVPAYENFNGVVSHATARLFAWSACDDLRHPTFLARMVEQHERDPELVLAFCQAETFGHGTTRTFFRKRRKIPAGEATPLRRAISFLRRLVGYPPIYGLLRRNALLGTRLFHADMGLAADIGLALELAVAGRFAFWPEVLFRVRRRADRNYLIGPDGVFDGRRHRRIDDRTRAWVAEFPLGEIERALVLRELEIWSRKGSKPRPFWWKIPGGRFVYLRSARALVDLRMFRHGL